MHASFPLAAEPAEPIRPERPKAVSPHRHPAPPYGIGRDMMRGLYALACLAAGCTSGGTAALAAEPDWHAALAPQRQTNTQAVVSAAYNFLYTLDQTQLSQTLLPFTLSNAEIWSNLPVASRSGPALGPQSSTTQSSTTTTGATGTTGSGETGTATGGTPPTGAGGTPPNGGGANGGGGFTLTPPPFYLNDTQRAAALALAQVAVSDVGFATMQGIRAADDVLAATENTGLFGSGLYRVAILGTPSTTAPWMLQIGGHHLAYNIVYNGAQVGATPVFLGVEPPNFTVLSDGRTVVTGTVNDSTLYIVNGQSTTTAPDGTVAANAAPLEAQRSAVDNLLQQVQADPAVAAAARLSASFDDVTMGSAGAGSHDTNYPFNPAVETAQLYPTGTTERGVLFDSLDKSQQLAVITAIAAWVNTQKIDIATELFRAYISPDALAQTYVAYSPGRGGTADFGPNPLLAASPGSAAGSYFRVDGPRVWIEAVVQASTTYRTQSWVHYHTLWRDKTADYGACFSSGADAPNC